MRSSEAKTMIDLLFLKLLQRIRTKGRRETPAQTHVFLEVVLKAPQSRH